ncbi:MAG: hypothetical protein J0I66_08640, partial [Microbacterium sp.]|nr:hypothetical protein [Microbacterium sp.]
TGTLIGVAHRGGFLDKDGKLPRIGKALMVDSTSAAVGAALGTSTTTSYIESAAGVDAGVVSGVATGDDGRAVEVGEEESPGEVEPVQAASPVPASASMATTAMRCAVRRPEGAVTRRPAAGAGGAGSRRGGRRWSRAPRVCRSRRRRRTT